MFSYEIFDTLFDGGVNSELALRSAQRGDGVVHKCVAENEFGTDERTIKLLVVGKLEEFLFAFIKETS